MSRSTHDLRVGERIGGYRIQRVLGRGGAGTVYEASGPAGPVALKVMHEHDPSGVGKKRFTREAALVQKLRHPHVVALLGFGHSDGDVPFIVFELLNGRSLKSVLRRQGAFELATAGSVALQILDALIAAHAMGIIHRDIKPANIYMCDDHGGNFVKVLDFGLAKALEGEGAEVATITDTGYRLGTPRYMSPEMARSQKVGEPGDLYGLGLVFAEMIAGQPVVKGGSQIDVLMAHANDDPLPLDAVVMQSPFGKAIQRSLAKLPQQRHASAREMRAEVEKALGFHREALAVAAKFGNVSPDAETVLLDRNRQQPAPKSDPLNTTSEMDPTPQMIAPASPAAPEVKPNLAATVAFPDDFDPAAFGLDPPEQSTAKLAAPEPTPLAALAEMPPATVGRPQRVAAAKAARNTGIILAIVLVAIVAAIGAGILLLR